MRTYLPGNTLHAIADAVARSVVIREYVNGSSVDVRKAPTKKQRAAVHSAALGALLGLNWGEDTRSNKGGGSEDAIINTAEFFLMCACDGLNGYDSIYNPLRAITEVWRCATEAGTRKGTLTAWAARLVWSMFPAWRDFFDGITAYPDRPEDLLLYGSTAEASATLAAWEKDGTAEDIPAHDAGLLFLLWNLYISDRKTLADASRI